MFFLVVHFHFQILEADVRACLDSENAAAENQEVANDNNGAAGYLAQGPDKEQAHAGNEGTHHKAGDGDSSLQAGQFYAGFLGHRALIVTDQEGEDERIVASVLEAGSPSLAGKDPILDMGLADAINGRVVLVATSAERKVCSNAGR